jgi:phage terminase large subunit
VNRRELLGSGVAAGAGILRGMYGEAMVSALQAAQHERGGGLERFAKYRDDPVGFIEEVLGRKCWGAEDSRTGHGGQRHFLEMLAGGDQIAWKKSRGVGGTYLLGGIVPWWLCTRPNSLVVTTAPTWEQVKRPVWANIRESVSRSTVKLPGDVLGTSWEIGPKHYAIGLSPRDPENFQGHHDEGGGTLFIADEAAGVEDRMLDAADGFLTSAGSKQIYVFNPTKAYGRAFEAAQPTSGWDVFGCSAFDAPEWLVTDRWIEQQRKKYGPDPENNPMFRAYVLGEFPLEGDDSLVSLALLERCQHLAAPSPEDGVHMGVDVARMGSDTSVAICTVNGRVRAIDQWSKRRVNETASRVLRLARAWNCPPENVHVDSGGVGGGVADLLRSDGFTVDEVDFGSRAVGDQAQYVGSSLKFKNRKAELFWAIRRRMDESALSIPSEGKHSEHLTTLWRELQAFDYGMGEDERLGVTKKDEIKERLGRSPDFADALAISLSRRSEVWMPRIGVA